MEWGDVLLIVLVAAGVWTFIPRHVRFTLRSVVSPLLRTFLDALHDGASVARKAITHAAYRGLLGVPVPDDITVKSREAEAKTEDVVEPVVTNHTAELLPIATPNNEYTDELSDNEFKTRAKVVAELYVSGAATNLSKTICQVFRCSVQSASKPESTYQRALREVNKHLPSGPRFRQDDGSTAPASRPVTGRRTPA